MDSTPVSTKTPPAAEDDAVPSAAQRSTSPESSSDDAAAVKAVVVGGGGGEDDDEQVERFYALLDNIRAMRGMLSSTGTAAGRKRAREAEPPWRPVFRMEDFEQLDEVDSDAAVGAGAKTTKKWESSARRPPADDEEQEEEEEGEVVEAKGPRPAGAAAQRNKARRAGVLAVHT